MTTIIVDCSLEIAETIFIIFLSNKSKIFNCYFIHNFFFKSSRGGQVMLVIAHLEKKIGK